MKKAFTITAAALLALSVAVAPATAKKSKKPRKQPVTGTYAGTTTGGSSISFVLGKGGQVRSVNSSIFVSCVSLQSSTAKGGVELFTPPAGVKLGTTEAQELQPSAVAGRSVTKNYTTTMTRQGKQVSGQLKVSFSYYIPDLYYPRIYQCFGTTDFSAKRG